MGEIVNLKRERKRQARAAKERDAAANREKFGRLRHERDEAEARRAQDERRLDQHKRDE